LNSAKNLVFGFFHVEIDKNKMHLKADIFGEKYTISKHKIGAEIKAVTYHMLEIRKKRPYHAQVLFDI
jgi:SHS2 domain-containing protein